MNNGNGNHHDHRAVLDLSEWKTDASGAILPLPPVMATSPTDRLEGIIRLLLTEMGVDVNSEHFRDTPARVARFYREFTQGYTVRPAEILKTFRSRSDSLVVVSHIDFFSLCPHHLLVYGGKIHFGYVPNGRIVGVSKIPRLVHALASRPVVQEALVADIADAFMSVVSPLGCAVKATGHHDCVAARGVKCPSAVMTTVATRGIFQEKESLCREFDQAILAGGNCTRDP